jgi:type I restriction enzyme S subunit
MPNNWNTYKLGDLLRIKHGFAFKGEFFSDEKNDNVLLTPGNFNSYGGIKFNWDKQKFYKGEFPVDYILNEGDLIIALTDLTQSCSILGSTAIIKDKDYNYLHNQRLGLVKDINPKVNANFLYYVFNNSTFRNHVIATKTGSTVSHTAPERIYNYEINIPEDIEEQQSIASILSAIDDKIENNLAINKTLEEMAMALYKHWFVDFGPFQDGEFVESELGMIPKGWEVKRLDELAEIGSSKRIFYDEYVAEGIPFYRGKEVIELSKGKSISSELFISEQKFNEIKAKFDIPTKGDILISSVGTIGVSWLVDGFEEFYFKDGNLTWIKKYKTFLKGEYLHLWLNSENGKDQINGEVIGSTQKALTISSLRNFKILFPNEEVYQQIGNEFIDYYEQRQLNLIEIKTLTQLRDTLLPQLISGAVRLKEFRE